MNLMRKASQVLDIQIKIMYAENFNSIIYEGREKEIKIYFINEEIILMLLVS